ncbi:MAG: glycosyltransferase family 39 protein [Deltaproteobacteria bacterium]|nr:glycosyltransferase family 39 protein [Deltaproteobacteria bacterium]
MTSNSKPYYLYLVVLLGLAIRLLAWTNTQVVNPDGTLYIFQAKAIYYGHKEALFCGYSFIANYPVMIAGVFGIVQDWIFAARLVSLLFGTAALIPLYLLLRRFFDIQISALCTLIFGMLPVFVGLSVDMVREPVCWFFLILGLFCYLKASEDNISYQMLFSSLSFLMAAWARIEVFLFIALSFLYLLFVKQENRIRKLIYFAGPLIFFLSGIGLYIYINRDSALMAHLRFKEFVDRLVFFYVQYKSLRDALKSEAFLHRHQMVGLFITAARNNAWLVDLGVLLNRVLETLLYLFAFVLAVGLPGIWKHIKRNIQARYLVVLSLGSMVLLFVQIFSTWWIEYRHTYLLIIPSFIIIGYGIERILLYSIKRFKIGRIAVFSILSLIIVLSTLPKNLQPRDTDKIIFKEIGETIAKHKSGDDAAYISTPVAIHQWVSFYANLSYQRDFCPLPVKVNCWEFNSDSYDQFIRHLLENRIKYLVWTEKQWPVDKIDFSQVQHHLNLKELGRWNHPMTGEIILLEIL